MNTHMKSHLSLGWRPLAVLASVVMSLPAHAGLSVFACEPEWAALVKELAGDQATVYTATHAMQDPHLVQARPSLIAAVRKADLVVCTGADLEVGWLPLLLRQSGNARVQVGQPGHFLAAAHVRMLDVPRSLDRADGDVHEAGNPHIQTAPGTFAAVAPALSARLASLDAAQAQAYRQRLADFQQRWSAATTRWTQAAAPLKGMNIVVQHQGFPYLAQWLGLRTVASLEPKPGVEASSTYLSGVLQQLKQTPAKAVIRAAYSDGRGAQWLADRAQLPMVVLPFTVGGSDRAKDLFGLFDDTVDQLLKVAR